MYRRLSPSLSSQIRRSSAPRWSRPAGRPSTIRPARRADLTPGLVDVIRTVMLTSPDDAFCAADGRWNCGPRRAQFDERDCGLAGPRH